jgi:hypothetical protein
VEEFEKLRRSNYSTGSTLFPHLSSNAGGSGGSPPDQVSSYQQQQQQMTQQYPSSNKSYGPRDSRESFDHLPNI